jgi:tetratricopeptide (TPR) repeat protein
MNRLQSIRRGSWLLPGALVLGACVAPAPQPTAPAFDAAALVQTIRAAGAASPTELDVQPLRDPQVEDLRQQAAQLEAKHMYRGAADLVDRALQLNAEDPALLQERAELALLLGEAAQAEHYAKQAIDLGSATGPLCRRHWETLLQGALLRANDRVIRRGESPAQATARVEAAAAEARTARTRRDACTVAALNRY